MHLESKLHVSYLCVCDKVIGLLKIMTRGTHVLFIKGLICRHWQILLKYKELNNVFRQTRSCDHDIRIRNALHVWNSRQKVCTLLKKKQAYDNYLNYQNKWHLVNMNKKMGNLFTFHMWYLFSKLVFIHIRKISSFDREPVTAAVVPAIFNTERN